MDNRTILLRDTEYSIGIKDWLKVISLLIRIIHDIANKELSIPNILDKHKYREVEIASILGHQVSLQSCAIQLPDAIDRRFNNNNCEYKTQNIKKSKRFKNNVKIKGFYSSANKIENIERVLSEQHYFAGYNNEKLWFILHVNNQEVYNQLKKNFNQRQKRDQCSVSEGKKIPKDDNWNAVGINVNLSVKETDIYTIKYLNPNI